MKYSDIEVLRALSPKRLIVAIGVKYEIPPEKLRHLLNDYELFPAGAQGPCDDDPYPGTMSEIADRVGLPVRAVGRLQDVGAISRPITHWDLDFLVAYRKAWSNSFLLRNQIQQYSQQQREDLIRRPELANRWERWAYAVFLTKNLNYGNKGYVNTSRGRILIDQVAGRVEEMFGVTNNERLKGRLRGIRALAENDRQRANREGVSVDRMASRRDVVLK